MTSIELADCPFCGPNSHVSCYEDDYFCWVVGCGRCGTHSGRRPRSDPEARQKVIALWNQRPDTAYYLEHAVATMRKRVWVYDMDEYQELPDGAVPVRWLLEEIARLKENRS